MEGLQQTVLLDTLGDCGEPLLLAHVSLPDWPIVFSNRAFSALHSELDANASLGSVLDTVFGREIAAQVSDAIHSRSALKFPLQLKGRECLLELQFPGGTDTTTCALHFRGASILPSAIADTDSQHALLSAKRRIKDLSREDSATGLLNTRAFRDVFVHDWAVANREKSSLSVIVIQLDDVDTYLTTFGPHALDSCLRRVGQCLRRSLRRASDLIAHTGAGCFVILSHASDADAIEGFAQKLTNDVRALGIHHPKSSVAKFVTAQHRVSVVRPADGGDADACLETTLGA